MLKINKRAFIVAILGLLVACSSLSGNKDACIPPLTDFAFFTGRGETYPDKPVAPPKPWIPVSALGLKGYSRLLGVRVVENQEREFWVWNEDPSALGKQSVYVFRSKGTNIDAVSIENKLFDSQLRIEKLFIARDNSIWLANLNSDRSMDPVLAKYDDAKGQIVQAAELGSIMQNPDYYPTIILLDSQTGVFWFLVPYGFIYSYDPLSDVVTQHMSIANINPTSASMTQDGKIYLYAFRRGSLGDEIQDALYLYTPQTETVDYITIGLEVDSYMKNLFVDHAGRLWAGTFGWMELNGDWYQTVRSPVFVLGMTEPRGERIYHWSPPEIQFEAPNDVFWFTSVGAGGTYSLDFKKGEWCWVSTSTQIQKDPENHLWMIFENQLYRLLIMQ